MVATRQLSDPPPLQVSYQPSRGRRAIPVEVVRRSELLRKINGHELASRQRADFHQLVACTEGSGVHNVDFERIALTPGTLLRIHPGQVQRFIPDSRFEALMVIWPIESHYVSADDRPWYPGIGVATQWHFSSAVFSKFVGWIAELGDEQKRFNGSTRSIALMQTLLRALLLRLAIETSESPTTTSKLPAPYVAFRQLLEDRLYERPAIAEVSSDLGYSSRTLDRACQQVSGQTAKQVLDERVALEVRRLLTHSSRPIGLIASDFRFNDPSNFSKFVKRHLGSSPNHVRAGDR